MSWYSAHIVMFVELKTESQQRYPVWENVVLVKARTEEEAFKKAERYGKAADRSVGRVGRTVGVRRRAKTD